MIELGQLEAQWQDFEKKHVQVVVVSVEDRETAEQTQKEFPHLIVVADAKHSLVDAVAVLASSGDTAVPTTILVDSSGVVRWMFRPDNVMSRQSPAELLAAVAKEMP